MPLPWLPPPEPGTAVCGGFDGSEVDDLTVIKLETFDGYLFTPRYGPDDRPTIWKPEDWGGRIPRHQVSIAWEQIAKRYRLQRVYCDPFQWQTDIEQWDAEYGPDVFAEFPTNKVSRIFPALTRFTTDLEQGRIRHDGCPTTTLHVNNAQRLAQRLVRDGLAGHHDDRLGRAGEARDVHRLHRLRLVDQRGGGAVGVGR